MRTYRMNVKQIDEHTFIQAEVPQTVITEIRADAIDELIALINITYGYDCASDLIPLAEQLKEQKNE